MLMTQNNKAKSSQPNTWANPVGLDGMEFIEYSSKDPEALRKLFKTLGFQFYGNHKEKKVELWSQGLTHFILNFEQDSFADAFANEHGPCVCATGFRVKDAQKAFDEVVKRGARPCPTSKHHSFPAVYGIGDSVIYFIDQYSNENPFKIYEADFNLDRKQINEGTGLVRIDHLTNNVPAGEMQKWCEFYENIFNFKETRFFDIQGQETGLVSKVMQSPCGKIIIPINEPKDDKSQIQEYLDTYKGSGIQHIAITTNNIQQTVKQLRDNGIKFLDTPDTYYDLLPKRLPNLNEDVDALRDLKVLADGDEEGYLLQIFTQNVIGPIFYEIIQRKKHDGFGEGNFQALFDSIEEDQRRRGFLK